MELIPGVVLHQDGTVDRSAFNRSVPFVQASEQDLSGVASKDVVIDPSSGVWVRIFLPKLNLQERKKLPVVVYFHGGGFVLLSAGSRSSHEHCCVISSVLGAIVVSVEYRLAPEFRLPVAFEDAYTSLAWLQAQARAQAEQDTDTEPWLREHGDFKSCVFMGVSAGGIIVNHLAVKAPMILDNDTLRVKGLISCAPGFGGSEATASEQRQMGGYECLSSIWKLALPENASLNHPYADVRGVEVDGFPPVLLFMGGQDLLIDRQLEFLKFLKERGVRVSQRVYDDHNHLDMLFLDAKHEGYSAMRDFVALII